MIEVPVESVLVIREVSAQYRATPKSWGCSDCATHTLPGQTPLEVRIFGADGEVRDVLKRE